MTPEQFAYWLQGFVELHGAPPTQEQWDSISDHLRLVFTKVTPALNRPGPPITPFRDPVQRPLFDLVDNRPYC